MLLLNLGDELPRDTLPTTSTRRVLSSGYRSGSDVEALGTPVLVVGAFTTLDGTEAHGVEPTLVGGRRYVPGTVLEAELGPPGGVEVGAPLYSGDGFLARSR